MSKPIPTTEELYEKTVEIYQIFVSQSPETKEKSLARLKRAIENEKDAEIKDFLKKLAVVLEGTAKRLEAENQTADDYLSDLETINCQNIENFEGLDELRKKQIDDLSGLPDDENKR